MIDLNPIQIFLVVLFYLHISISTYEIYYHRGIIHNGLDFSPFMSWIFQFISWLMFYQIPNKYYMCGHIIHHKYSDTYTDPHGHISLGFKQQFLFKPFKKIISQLIETFNLKKKCIYPPTKIQKKILNNLNNLNNFYAYEFFEKNSQYGNFIFLIINFLIFGIDGILIYFLFVLLSNLSRDIILDGLAHLVGYTNFNIKNNSKNIFPFGIFFAGSELHNNHHASPNNIKCSKKWFEIDVGWIYIILLNYFNLVKFKNVESN